MRTRGAVPKWLREQSAKLRCSGSTPLGASKQSLLVPLTSFSLYCNQGQWINPASVFLSVSTHVLIR